MLNYVAFYLLSYLLATPGLLQAPGSANPKTPPTPESAQLPRLLGTEFNLTWGFVLALLAVVGVWWLLNRSSLGFTFRAVGENPRRGARGGHRHRPRHRVASCSSPAGSSAWPAPRRCSAR